MPVVATIFLGVPFCAGQSPAQHITDTNAVSWLMYAGHHPTAAHWGVFTYIHAGRAHFLTVWQQLVIRTAATYRFSPHVQVAAGYVWTRTGRYGDFPAPKPYLAHRAYEQLVLKQEFKHLDIEHRYRVEQRWLQNFTSGDAYSWGYDNRFRYQLKGTLPISKAGDEGQRWHLFGAGEVLLHSGPNHGPDIFNQTRALGGIGYRFSMQNKIEFAYQHQYLAQRNGRIYESNHGLRVQFSSTAKLFRKG